LVEGLEPLLLNMGAPFLIGGAAGYAVKKVMKLVALGIGMIVAILMYLESQHMIIVNRHTIETGVQNASVQSAHFIQQTANQWGGDHFGISSAMIPIAGFGMGFLLGFYKG
jgi:uncharacterized membrane protein (Fun14 family)